MNDLTAKERARIRVVEFLNSFSPQNIEALDDLLDDLEQTFYNEYYFRRNRND